MPRPLTPRDILAMDDNLVLPRHDFALPPTSRDTYLECHAKRYARLLNAVAARTPAAHTARDIGPGFRTTLRQGAFPPPAIDTLGGGFVPQFARRHHAFDLNDFHH